MEPVYCPKCGRAVDKTDRRQSSPASFTDRRGGDRRGVERPFRNFYCPCGVSLGVIDAITTVERVLDGERTREYVLSMRLAKQPRLEKYPPPGVVFRCPCCKVLLCPVSGWSDFNCKGCGAVIHLTEKRAWVARPGRDATPYPLPYAAVAHGGSWRQTQRLAG